MNQKYNDGQRDISLEMMNAFGGIWAKVFTERDAYSTYFWHLFRGLYERRNEEISKKIAKEILRPAAESGVTQEKIIERAKSMGYVSIVDSKTDRRSKAVKMTPKLEKKMRQYIDETIRVMEEGIKKIEKNKKSSRNMKN
jgi:DNA-binding MarR family transcriptional regulator